MSEESRQPDEIESSYESVEVLTDERYSLEFADVNYANELDKDPENMTRSSMFPIFSTIKEEVHMIIRQRCLLYLLIKRDLLERFDEDGGLLKPQQTLDDVWDQKVFGGDEKEGSSFQTYIASRQSIDVGDTITELLEMKKDRARSNQQSLFEPGEYKDDQRDDSLAMFAHGKTTWKKKPSRVSSFYKNSLSEQEQQQIRGSIHALHDQVKQFENSSPYMQQHLRNFKLTKRRVQQQGSRVPTQLSWRDILIQTHISTPSLQQHALALAILSPDKLGAKEDDVRSQPSMLRELHITALQLAKVNPALADSYTHKMSLADLLNTLQTNSYTGLSAEVVSSKKAETSEFPQPQASNVYIVLLRYLFTGFAGVFWASAFSGVISYACHESRVNELIWFDISFIISTTMVLNICSFLLQWHYAAITRLPTDLVKSTSKVIRNGKTRIISTKELQPGDIMLLRYGDVVNADCRIVSSSADLCCCQDNLNGDGRHIVKSTEWTDVNIFYSQNQLLAGSRITRGTCRVVVVEVGRNTVLGKCYLSPLKDHQHKATILDDLQEFFKYSTMLSVVCEALGFGLNLRRYSPLEAWLNTFSVVFSNAPESILAAVTLGFALAQRNLRKKSIDVLQLRAVEDFAAVDTICIEITGGLTQGTPEVQSVWQFDNERGMWIHEHSEILENTLFSENSMWKLHQAEPQVDKNTVFSLTELPFPTLHLPPSLHWVLAVCILTVQRNSLLNALNPVETALRNWCEHLLPLSEHELAKWFERHSDPCTEIVDSYDRVLYIPNTHRDRLCLSICRSGNVAFVMFRGAFSEVLELCENMWVPYRDVPLRYRNNCWQYDESQQHLVTLGNGVPLTQSRVEALTQACHCACSQGRTVLACGFMVQPTDTYPADYVFTTHPPNFHMKGAVLCGLLSLVDPIRPLAGAIVQELQELGVQPVLMTSDSLWLAESVAVEVGAQPADDVRYITSQQGMHSMLPKPSNKPGQHLVVDGSAIWAHGEGVWRAIWAAKSLVISGSSATNKGIIIQRLEEARKVAVQGVCVHDTLALKLADLPLNITSSHALSDISSVSIPSVGYLPMAVQYCRNVTTGCRQAALHGTQKLLAEMICTTMIMSIFDVPHPQTTMNVMLLDFILDVLPSVALLSEVDASVRGQHVQRLLTRNAIFWVYLVQGIFFTAGVLLAYFFEFQHYGLDPINVYENGHNLLSDKWENALPARSRQDVYRRVKSATLISFALQQHITVFTRKNRILPAIPQRAPWKVFDNMYLNLSVLLSLILLVVVIYAPPLNYFFDILPPCGYAWIYPLFTGLYQAIMIEIHKCLLRKLSPSSRIYKFLDY